MRSRLLVLLLSVALLATFGCGGGSSSPSTSFQTQQATPSVVQVTLGDDPGDRVASLSITVNSVTLTSTTGSTATLVSTPTTVEISSLQGTTTPLGTVTVPAGTYNKATIALGSATLTIVDPSTGTTVQKTFNAPANPFTINLNPAFVSDGSALVINFDMDLHASVAIDSQGNITFNPLFLASHGRMVMPPVGVMPNPFTGGVERVVGKVGSVLPTTFEVIPAIGQKTLTFAVNSSTVFNGVGGLSGLHPGMLVIVGGQAQADGTLLALKVLVVEGIQNTIGAVGIVSSTTGTPVTQFKLLTNGLTLSTTMTGLSPVPQVMLTVDVTSTTHFEPDSEDIDLGSLNLTFNASSLSPAQAVVVNTTGALTIVPGTPVTGSLTAAQVRLVQQPLTGTISNLTTDSFTLTVPSDGVFATLAKTNTVTVYRRSKTVVKDGLTLANGQKVIVRGLLFNNSGYQMVAARIGN